MKDIFTKLSLKFDMSMQNYESENYNWNNEMYKKQYGYFVSDESIQIDTHVLFDVILKAGYGDRSQISLLIELLTPLFRYIPFGVSIMKL